MITKGAPIEWLHHHISVYSKSEQKEKLALQQIWKYMTFIFCHKLIKKQNDIYDDLYFGHISHVIN
jgi:hypothetical protein